MISPSEKDIEDNVNIAAKTEPTKFGKLKLVLIIQTVLLVSSLIALFIVAFSHSPHPPSSSPSSSSSSSSPSSSSPSPPSSTSQSCSSSCPDPPSIVDDVSHHSWSMLAKFKKAAVVSDHGICSEIGRSILTRGGNAVDASIATLLCIGVTNPQSSGIGGGFFMNIYRKEKGSCTSINSRETAPQGIDVEFYKNNSLHTSYGWKSIGVPGEIRGFWLAYSEYGSKKVPWKDLLEPTIKLCREGIPVSEYLAQILADKNTSELVNGNKELSSMFTNPETNEYYKEGDIMYRRKLATTLEILSESKNPSELFYKGVMAETIVREIKEGGGYITMQDMESFQPRVAESVTSSITDDLTMCGLPPPSSWIVTQLIVKVMEVLYPAPRKKSDLNTRLFYHRLIEAEKFAYAKRSLLGDAQFVQNMTAMIKNLTDPATAKSIASMIKDNGPLDEKAYDSGGFVKEDHGTSHVSVIDDQGNAVSVTSTINLWLGSKVASPSLGIIWNDQIDDFSVPGQKNAFGYNASTANLIEPGKIPMSSMSPTIVYNNKDKKVRAVIGTTGGSKIIQGVASVTIRSLLFGQTIKEAIDAPQIFHQITPPYVQYEPDFPKSMLDELSGIGHTVKPEENMHSTTHAIVVDENDGYIYANSDKRNLVHMHPDGY